MNSLLRVLLMLVLTVGLLAARSALPQSVNGSISGSVEAGGNTAPLTSAKVTLVRREGRTGLSELTATTDKDGHFHINDVPPGLYSVAVTAVGYVRSTVDMSAERYMAVIESGKETTDFVVFMAKETIVEGRILDPDGSPSAGAQVHTFTMEGKLRDSFSRVDENGHFRLTVAPGRFVISGDYEPAETDSVRTFYPGVVDRQSAIPLKLDEGETIRDLEFHLQTATRVRVSGVVKDPFLANSSYTGNAYLEPQGTGQRSSQDFSPSAPIELLPGKEDPQFQFEAIKSGDYNLFVVMSEAAGRYHLGKLPITVGAGDVKDLVVVARPGVDVKGRIVAQGTDLPDTAAMHPVLIPFPEALPEVIQTVSKFGSATFDSRSEFTIANVPPGDYVVRLALQSPDIALVESRKGTKPLTNGSFSVSTEFSEPLALMVSQAGTISGTVADTNGKPAPMVPVLLLPEKAARLNATDLRRASTDSSGNYQIRGVTPGNYVILSLIPSDASALEQNEWRGYPVSVTSGGNVIMNLPFLGVILPTP